LEGLLQRLGIALNYQQEMMLVALMMIRTAALALQTPWLGGKNVPPEIKIGISVMVTIIIYPVARRTVSSDIPLTAIPFVFLMLKEGLIGFSIGFAACVFDAFEVAGRMIDTVRGSSMAEVMVPLSGERATPMGDVFFQLLIVIFMAVGGHRIFFEAYAHSFEVLPVDKHLAYGVALWPFIDMMMKVCAEILFIGVLISAPVIAATFLTDLVFGILNRVAPQLNAYFLSMPVKAMAGIIMIFVALTPLVQRMIDYAVWSLEVIEETIGLLVRAS
jgi:flagellar biosynthetic protein FliR